MSGKEILKTGGFIPYFEYKELPKPPFENISGMVLLVFARKLAFFHLWGKCVINFEMAHSLSVRK